MTDNLLSCQEHEFLDTYRNLPRSSQIELEALIYYGAEAEASEKQHLQGVTTG